MGLRRLHTGGRHAAGADARTRAARGRLHVSRLSSRIGPSAGVLDVWAPSCSAVIGAVASTGAPGDLHAVAGGRVALEGRPRHGETCGAAVVLGGGGSGCGSGSAPGTGFGTGSGVGSGTGSGIRSTMVMACSSGLRVADGRYPRSVASRKLHEQVGVAREEVGESCFLGGGGEGHRIGVGRCGCCDRRGCDGYSGLGTAVRGSGDRGGQKHRRFVCGPLSGSRSPCGRAAWRPAGLGVRAVAVQRVGAAGIGADSHALRPNLGRVAFRPLNRWFSFRGSESFSIDVFSAIPRWGIPAITTGEFRRSLTRGKSWPRKHSSQAGSGSLRPARSRLRSRSNSSAATRSEAIRAQVRSESEARIRGDTPAHWACAGAGTLDNRPCTRGATDGLDTACVRPSVSTSRRASPCERHGLPGVPGQP
jgi:hypothetical protein